MQRIKPPKYRRHSTRDFGFVEFHGKRHRLPGRYDSSESRTAYRQWLRDHGFLQTHQPTGKRLCLAEVMIAYTEHAERYYGDRARGTARTIKCSIGLLINRAPEGYGLAYIAASEFGPLKLKGWREWLITRGSARRTINDHVARIKQAIKWAVSEELIDPSVHHALQTVRGLSRGRSEAREPEPRQPANWHDVESVLHHLDDPVASMVYLQWLTGARSDSICRATPKQFTREGSLLLWRPRHKNEWRGRELVLPIGPIGQLVLAPFLARPADQPLFSPRDKQPNHSRYNDRYSPWTYRQRIVRVQQKKGVPAWTPHQLRHARAQLVRDRFGLEAAQAALGHDSIDATQIYSVRRLGLAKEVALACG